MKEENDIKQQLNKPHAPDELKGKIYSNWEGQLQSSDAVRFKGETSKIISLNKIIRPFSVRMLAAATSFVFIFSSWLMFDSTPAVVYAALGDVKNEEKHQGYSVSVKDIVDNFQIEIPSTLNAIGMMLETTKYCTLDKDKMLHLQLVKSSGLESEGNQINVFLSEHEISPALWQEKDGFFSTQKNKEVTWKIMHPRPDLYVLILFGTEVQRETIKKMTKEMFYT